MANTTPTPAGAAKRQFLSKVFKAAWTIVRRDGASLSQALKKAWAWAKKNAGRLTQPAFDPNGYYILLGFHVEKSTAKAYLLKHEDYPLSARWAPRSVVVDTPDGWAMKGWFAKREDWPICF